MSRIVLAFLGAAVVSTIIYFLVFFKKKEVKGVGILFCASLIPFLVLLFECLVASIEGFTIFSRSYYGFEAAKDAFILMIAGLPYIYFPSLIILIITLCIILKGLKK